MIVIHKETLAILLLVLTFTLYVINDNMVDISLGRIIVFHLLVLAVIGDLIIGAVILWHILTHVHIV